MQLFLDTTLKSRSINVAGDGSDWREGVVAGIFVLICNFEIYRGIMISGWLFSDTLCSLGSLARTHWYYPRGGLGRGCVYVRSDVRIGTGCDLAFRGPPSRSAPMLMAGSARAADSGARWPKRLSSPPELKCDWIEIEISFKILLVWSAKLPSRTKRFSKSFNLPDSSSPRRTGRSGLALAAMPRVFAGIGTEPPTYEIPQ